MPSPVFPALQGIGWPVVQRPIWNTLNEQAAAGNEYNLSTMLYPLYEWDIVFNYFTRADLLSLMGLYNNSRGAFTGFYFDSIGDDTIAAASPYGFGIGDGSNKTFSLLKPVGSFPDLVGGTGNNWGTNPAVNNVIYDNGTPVSAAAYTASDGGFGPKITFTSAPANTHVLTWSGVYYYFTKFKSDSTDFSQFAYQMYENTGFTLRTKR